MKSPFTPLLVCGLALFSICSLANESRDPTRPPAVPVRASIAHEPAPVLSAIMGGPFARVAIFNGQLVHQGSSVGSYLIEAVLKDGVRYRHAGTAQELHFPHLVTSVKKSSTAAARLPAGAP